MERSFDVSDSTDWLRTPLALLAPVESALRCQVCKDFFDTPMITSCSHTFCSLCIRRCLTDDGKCPACRAADQELRLRRNWTVQELVDAYRNARSSVLQLGRDVVAAAAQTKNHQGHKRKLEDIDAEEEGTPNLQRRKTRSQSRKSPNLKQTDGVYIIEDDADSDNRHDDGLVACPSCGRRMKEENVFSHLDTCNGENDTSDALGVKAAATSRPSYISTQAARPKTPTKPLDRLPKLNYTILKDIALKKKLAELGIPGWGNKALLARRHSEWVNLWNSNCDSSKPRTKRELLQELDTWERSQGGLASNMFGGVNGGGSVMKKDFDGSAWAANHNEEFQHLIAKARQKPKTPAASTEAEAKSNSEPIPYSDGGADRQICSFDSIKDRRFYAVDGQNNSGPNFDSAMAEAQPGSEYTPQPNSVEKSVVDLETDIMEIPTKDQMLFEQSQETTNPIPQLRQQRTLAQGALVGRPPDNT